MVWIIGGAEDGLSWSAARDKVRSDLWRKGSNAIPDDVVDRALHASILEIEAARKWQWLQQIVGNLALASPSNQLDLPASCGPIYSLSVFAGSPSPDRLELLPSVAQARAVSATSQGFPSCYAVAGGIAHLDSTAAAGTAFELIFDAKCPDQLEVAILTPSLTLRLHQQAALAGAKRNVALEFLHDDDKANRAAAAFDNHLRRMEDRDDQLRSDESGSCIQPNTDLFFAAHGRT